MTWFNELTGCPEESLAEVRTQLFVEGPLLHSRRNGGSWQCGELETPTLAELRERVAGISLPPKRVTVREVVGDVRKLHVDPNNANAFFQVASQFNLLEMTGPEVTPERGVGIYEWDGTQGPTCAIAAGAGTIFRNYFAPVNGRIGQTADNQIDCLAGIGQLLGNTNQRLWKMSNGYALPSADGLAEINSILQGRTESEIDQLRQALQIGLQWNAQVTADNCSHSVSQAYCSALPVAYGRHPVPQWTRFAELILEASYEATFCAAIINAHRTGNPTVYLTMIGGGVFGNDLNWIMTAIRRSLALYPTCGLDIAMVSYGKPRPVVQQLVSEAAG
ncbi:MAG: hypothetical protein R3C49_18275 [Planctomycetaceae bacterium]